LNRRKSHHDPHLFLCDSQKEIWRKIYLYKHDELRHVMIWQFRWLIEFSISIYLNDLYYHVFLFNSLKKFAKRTVCDSVHQELMNHQQSATGMTCIFPYSLVIGCPHHCRVCSLLLLDPWIFTTRSVCKFKFASEPEFFGF
jgi:hypothetical protein